MILLWGLKEDLPLRMVYDELMAMGAEVELLDHREIFNTDVEVSYARGINLEISCGTRTLKGADIDAVYQRPYNYFDYKELENKSVENEAARHAARFEHILQSWMDGSGKLIVNRTDLSASNFSKPYQLSLIQQAGFRIPETLISNDPDSVLAFLKDFPDCIFKSISAVRSIVRQVGAPELERLEDIRGCPTLFQRLIPGINHRVHVVRNRVFATKILSNQVDYRYGMTSMEPTVLPVDIAQRCVELTKQLGLHFSGIDLMNTPNGEWYCFEVNPSPAYSYFQLNDGQGISRALAEFLLESAEARASG